MDDVIAELERGGLEVPFFEVCPENYLGRGGGITASLRRIAREVPLLSHGLSMSFGGGAPGGRFDPEELEFLAELRTFLDALGAPYHSDHLAVTSAQGRFAHELLPMPWGPGALAHVAERVAVAEDRLGRPILIENISAYFEVDPSGMSELEFFLELLQKTRALMLLDVNNLVVNETNAASRSSNLRPFDPFAFVDALPSDRIAAIHIAGAEWKPALGRWVDTHGAAVGERTKALFAATLRKTGPIPVVLERDSNVPPFEELLREREELSAIYDEAVGERSAPSSPGDR